LVALAALDLIDQSSMLMSLTTPRGRLEVVEKDVADVSRL
jgi:hypothetical protein